MNDVINLQNRISIDIKSIRTFAAKLASHVPELDGRTFSIAIVPDDRMHQLNSFFRGKSSTTDVLSFPHQPDEFDRDNRLGDIVISAEQAQRQAAENHLSLEDEIRQLILHGALHLCGYDHERDDGEMNARELELRDTLRL